MNKLTKRQKWSTGLAISFSIYLLFGFLGIPALTLYLIEERVEPMLDIKIDIAEIKTNPLTFEIEINNLVISEATGEQLLKTAQIYINLTPAYLVTGLASIEKISIVEPSINAIVNNQSLNLLLPLNNFPSEESVDETPDSGLPWLIKALTIEGGIIAFTHITPSGKFTSVSDDINISLNDLQSAASGTLGLGSQFNKKSPIQVDGNIQISPLDINLKVDIKDLNLKDIAQHPDVKLPLSLDQGLLSGLVNVSVTMTDEMSIIISDSSLTISNVNTSLDDEHFVGVESLAVNDINVNVDNRNISIGSCVLQNIDVNIKKDEDKNLNISALLNESTTKEVSEPQVKESTEWQFALKQCDVKSSVVSITDASVTPPIEKNINDIAITIKNFTLEEDNITDIQLSANLADDASITVSGQSKIMQGQVNANIEIKNSSMIFTQGYLNTFTDLHMKNGRVHALFDLNLDPQATPKLDIIGDISVTDFDSEHALSKEELLSWNEIKAHKLHITYAPLSIDIPKLTISEADMRIAISKERELNLLTVLKVPENIEKSEIDTSQPLKLSINEILFTDNKVRFSDDSLLLPFITYISKVNGNITPINIGSEQPSVSDIAIKGQIDKYGEASLNGTLILDDPAALTELKLNMDNIALNNLSPYSGTFSGYKLAEGKLDVGVDYKVDKQQLDSKNSIHIRNIKLGEIVDKEKAGTLPIGLAIAIMEDNDGLIALDLPIHGDMNNPDFEYGHLIGQAIGNLFTKVLTAPFALLAGLAGGDDLQFVQFIPGSYDLSLQEKEKLNKLAEALGKRKTLTLDIPLCSLPEKDSPALKELSLKTTIKNSKLDRVAYLEKNYIESHGIKAADALKKKHTIKTKESEKLDLKAYLMALHDSAIGKVVLENDAVISLAKHRFEALKNHLITNGNLNDHQVKQTDAVTASLKQEKLRCEFSLSTGPS